MRPVYRIELFGEQAYIIAARRADDRTAPRFRVAALQYVIVDEPKAACQKCSLARRQAIVGIFCFVAENEFIIDQSLSSIACSVPWTRGSVAGRKPTRGISSRLASSRL